MCYKIFIEHLAVVLKKSKKFRDTTRYASDYSLK